MSSAPIPASTISTRRSLGHVVGLLHKRKSSTSKSSRRKCTHGLRTQSVARIDAQTTDSPHDQYSIPGHRSFIIFFTSLAGDWVGESGAFTRETGGDEYDNGGVPSMARGSADVKEGGVIDCEVSSTFKRCERCSAGGLESAGRLARTVDGVASELGS